jgi:hypothetical protein
MEARVLCFSEALLYRYKYIRHFNPDSQIFGCDSQMGVILVLRILGSVNAVWGLISSRAQPLYWHYIDE